MIARNVCPDATHSTADGAPQARPHLLDRRRVVGSLAARTDTTAACSRDGAIDLRPRLLLGRFGRGTNDCGSRAREWLWR